MRWEPPEELKDVADAFREEVQREIGPTCVLSKCKVRVLKRESDGDIQLRFTHYCGKRGHLTPI